MTVCVCAQVRCEWHRLSSSFVALPSPFTWVESLNKLQPSVKTMAKQQQQQLAPPPPQPPSSSHQSTNTHNIRRICLSMSRTSVWINFGMWLKIANHSEIKIYCWATWFQCQKKIFFDFFSNNTLACSPHTPSHSLSVSVSFSLSLSCSLFRSLIWIVETIKYGYMLKRPTCIHEQLTTIRLRTWNT